MISWREFTESLVAFSRPKIWTMSRFMQLTRGYRFLHLSNMQCDDHIIAHYKLPLKN